MPEANVLIRELKVSHETLVVSLADIHATIRSFREAKPHLRRLQDRLGDHFVKQGAGLFKDLRERFKDSREELKMVEFLRVDLNDLKIRTLTFFDEHPSDMGDLQPKNIVSEFMDLSEHIGMRIRIEREKLFPLLQNY